MSHTRTRAAPTVEQSALFLPWRKFVFVLASMTATDNQRRSTSKCKGSFTGVQTKHYVKIRALLKLTTNCQLSITHTHPSPRHTAICPHPPAQSQLVHQNAVHWLPAQHLTLWSSKLISGAQPAWYQQHLQLDSGLNRPQSDNHSSSTIPHWTLMCATRLCAESSSVLPVHPWLHSCLMLQHHSQVHRWHMVVGLIRGDVKTAYRDEVLHLAALCTNNKPGALHPEDQRDHHGLQLGWEPFAHSPVISPEP